MTSINFAHNGELLREALVPKHFSTLVDSLFNETVRNTGTVAPYRPSVDILEKEANFEIQVALPGLKKEDISLEIKENRLVLKGERKQVSEENSARYHSKETYYGTFARNFRLPENANKETIHAEFKDGILNIIIAKQDEKANTTAIEIK